MKMRIRQRIFLILILTNISLSSCSWHSRVLPKPSTGHIPQASDDFRLVWSLSDVYTIQDSTSPMISADSGIMCFIGALANNVAFRLYCLNGNNGIVLWKSELATAFSDLIVRSRGVYIAQSGNAGVAKYDENGDIIWSRSFPGTGIKYMYVNDDKVHIYLVPEKYVSLFVDDGTTTYESQVDRTILFSDSSITYVNNNGLQAIRSDTGEIIWHVDLDDEFELTPIFFADVIYIRTGRVIGSIYAIDRWTGEVKWKTEASVVSNIAVSDTDNQLYVITRNGLLWSISEDSGEITTLLEFTNVPFILNGEDIVGGYEIAYDETIETLFILLGDSRQLFAFQVK